MYIDPNTGGMLFQILAALFALISGAILFFSGKIRFRQDPDVLCPDAKAIP
jgi:hypothetical protein